MRWATGWQLPRLWLSFRCGTWSEQIQERMVHTDIPLWELPTSTWSLLNPLWQDAQESLPGKMSDIVRATPGNLTLETFQNKRNEYGKGGLRWGGPDCKNHGARRERWFWPWITQQMCAMTDKDKLTSQCLGHIADMLTMMNISRVLVVGMIFLVLHSIATRAPKSRDASVPQISGCRWQGASGTPISGSSALIMFPKTQKLDPAAIGHARCVQVLFLWVHVVHLPWAFGGSWEFGRHLDLCISLKRKWCSQGVHAACMNVCLH